MRSVRDMEVDGRRCLVRVDFTLLGGGETGEAVEELGLADEMDHVSTGGGAFVAYLERGDLPGLAALR